MLTSEFPVFFKDKKAKSYSSMLGYWHANPTRQKTRDMIK